VAKEQLAKDLQGQISDLLTSAKVQGL